MYLCQQLTSYLIAKTIAIKKVDPIRFEQGPAVISPNKPQSTSQAQHVRPLSLEQCILATFRIVCSCNRYTYDERS